MSGILAAVLMRDADLEATPRAFGRCCDSVWPAKLGSAFSHISGARILLDQAPASAPAVAPRRSTFAWVVTALMTVVATVLAAALWKGSRGVEHPLMRLNVNLELEAALDDDLIPMAISPDGSRLAFTTERRREGNFFWLYTRSISPSRYCSLARKALPSHSSPRTASGPDFSRAYFDISLGLGPEKQEPFVKSLTHYLGQAAPRSRIVRALRRRSESSRTSIK